MQPSARDSYLETQVMTASPYKLRQMLIEGAIRFVKQTEQLWSEARDEEALESSIRAREIVGELMSSLSPDKSPLAKQLLPLYSYIFRSLTQAQLERSTDKLQDALRVLEEERETWRLVHEKFGGDESLQRSEVQEIAAPATVPTPAPAPTKAAPTAPILSFDSANMLPAGMVPAPRSTMPAALPNGGYSFEA